MDCFDGSTTNFERQETSGMNNLFREIDLKVAHYFPAPFPPTLDARKSRVFEQLAAFVECIVKRSILPFVKDEFSH